MKHRTALHCGACGARCGTAWWDDGRVRIVSDPRQGGRHGDDRIVRVLANVGADDWPVRARCPRCAAELTLDPERARDIGRRRRVVIRVSRAPLR